MPLDTASPHRSGRAIQAIAWAAMLLVSGLPNILFVEGIGQSPSWLFPAKLLLMLALLAAGVVWRPARRLRMFFLVVFVLYAAEWATGRVGELASWRDAFSGSSFVSSMAGTQLLRLIPAFVLVALLWILKRRRSAFYLVRGDTSALAEPVALLGMKASEPWSRVGRTLALYISLGTLLFLVLAGRPSAAALLAAAPLLPAVLLFAAMNAFSEEMSYRASFLATLVEPLGARQAVQLTAVFFGIGHYYGVPYGVVGVIMAGFLGWLLGKAMVETKGFFWAWFIHFLQDVMIFTFMAIGSVTPGGR